MKPISPAATPPDPTWLSAARAKVRRVLFPGDSTVHAEPPSEHARNALQLVRLAIETGEPMLGNGTPGVVVPITTLARLQARLELLIEQLADRPVVRCRVCDGTILAPAIAGAPRGTCHCPSNR